MCSTELFPVPSCAPAHHWQSAPAIDPQCSNTSGSPVALFWFLVLIAEKLGMAVPMYGILGLEGLGYPTLNSLQPL